MKTVSLLAAMLLMGISMFAQASELVTKDAQTLGSAKYLVLGRVTATSFDQKKFTGTMEVAVIEILKGKIEAKSLRLPVDKNPMDGFDVLLNKGDVAVFFIREIKDGNAYLIAPGASATFSREYFK